MNRLFNQDNRLMRGLSKLFDIGWLSILYVIFCIPVITIGPATTALYYTAIKVLRRERGYVSSEFWGCFKREFKNGAILGILFTVAYSLLGFNMYYITNGDMTNYGGYLYGVYLAMLIVVTCVLCYAFPILSRIALKPLGVLRLALYMAIKHLPFTIIHLVIVIGGVALVVMSFFMGIPMALIVVPGACAMIYTLPMEFLLKKYQPKSEPRYTEDGELIVEWYEE